jgi:putative transposase
MPRRQIAGTGGLVFHVLNRGVRRTQLFDQHGDYQAFLLLVAEACRRVPVRLLAYCLMPTHFHFIVWPSEDGQLSRFMWWLTTTHSKRWHMWRGTTGTGHVYQGRFKAFPVETKDYFLTVCRYVERNPLRANLVTKAEDWPWSSLAQRCRMRNTVPLEAWPILPPLNWLELVNGLQTQAEVEALRQSIASGRPYGSDSWVGSVASDFGLPERARRPGRPRKTTPGVVSRKQLPALFS